MAKEIVALAAIFFSAIIALVGLQTILTGLSPLDLVPIIVGSLLVAVGSGIIVLVVKQFFR